MKIDNKCTMEAAYLTSEWRVKEKMGTLDVVGNGF